MKQLTDKQQKFLEVLFEEAQGSAVMAKKLAGYSDTTSTSHVVNSLKEEIIDATQTFLSRNAPKAAMAMVGPNDLKIIKGKELIKLYQFHTKTAKHYFCSVCGIYTHHNPRRDPSLYGFNVACLENVNPDDLKYISLVDGANHPLDKKK